MSRIRADCSRSSGSSVVERTARCPSARVRVASSLRVSVSTRVSKRLKLFCAGESAASLKCRCATLRWCAASGVSAEAAMGVDSAKGSSGGFMVRRAPCAFEKWRGRQNSAKCKPDLAAPKLRNQYDFDSKHGPSDAGIVPKKAYIFGASTAMVMRDTQVSSPASLVRSICQTWVVRPTWTGRVMPVTQPLVAPFRWLALMSSPTAR